MKLVLVIPLYQSFQAFLMPLTEAFIRKGHTVLVVCSNPPSGVEVCPDDLSNGLEFRAAPLPRGFSPLSYLRAVGVIRQIIQEETPDLIHAHFSAAAFACALAKRRDWPPFLVTFQGLVFTQLGAGVKRWLIRYAELFTIRRSTASWVLTQDDHAAVSGALPEGHIHLQQASGFGCDLTCFDRSAQEKSALESTAQKLMLQKDDFIFIFVGRWTAFKGFPLVNRAFRSVRSQHSNARLILVGDFDSLHPSGLDVDELKSLFSEPGVTPAGWCDHVAPLLALSDAMVFPSEREGMSVCIMEALSMGLPVITSRARGCGDLVKHDYNGIIVERDVNAIALAMLSLIERPVELETLTKNALNERMKYDRGAYIAEQISIYEKYS